MSEPATGIAPVQRSPVRWILLLLVLLLVVAFVVVPWININRYHRTIADSLSSSLGRPVHLGSVQLEMLPHTGLAVTDFVVEENPGFGAEPILRAPSVLVTLRLSSLWGGHLEASRIDLDNASVNIVRDARGQWNFNSLLIQAARSPGPTPQRHAAAHRLPYIEFRSARINFKTGAEKRAFSFLNSDVSIWLDEPDQWRLRFEGQPARTDLDLDLADTGIVRLDGSLNRAAALDQIPLKIHAEWSKAPLGQVSRLLLGQDSGWRGLLNAEADLAGDLRNLQVSARLRIDDAHRQEFTPLKQLNVDARCRAVYHRAPQSPAPRFIDDLTCLWPIGDGHLLLTGSIRTPLQPQPNLTLEINHTPAEFALNLLGLLRRGVTASLSADGMINGHFTYTGSAFAKKRSSLLSGQATVDSLALTFPGLDKPLNFSALRFTTPDLFPPSQGKAGAPKRNRPVPAPEMQILLAPAPLSLGAPEPVQLSGQFTAAGFQLRTAGLANLGRLVALGRSSGLLG
ncbi:MAG TPA: AsmA family protein, partial [Silvibacterium sp.]|nr:AsmA family protein [Silvibacterium sp.]